MITLAKVTWKYKGNYVKTKTFLNKNVKINSNIKQLLKYYGEVGVAELQRTTPKDTGKTAASWDYKIDHRKDSITIYWTNPNENDGWSVALLILYGHAIRTSKGTRTGRWVKGIDYINPALKPVFDKMADEIWEEVTK